jgi:prepilin peptidase CpaA
LVFLCAFLTWIAVCDVRTRRISNRSLLPLAAAGLFHALVLGGWANVLAASLGGIAGVALLALPFGLGVLGGGDAKLLGAIGCWVGVTGVFHVLLAGSVAGGALAGLALLRAGRRGARRAAVEGGGPTSRATSGAIGAPARTIPRIGEIDPARGIPYGVALVAGAFWVLCIARFG